MTQIPQAVERNVEWLRSEVVALFESATRASEKDIASCTKLAELLYKLLPKGKEASATTDVQRKLADHRARVLEQGAPALLEDAT